jgi:hypothetical protein
MPGGMGGIPGVEECTGVTPVDGEPCDESLTACQTDSGICACFGAGGDDPTWNCFSGEAGMGNTFGGAGRGTMGGAGRSAGGGRGGFGEAGNGA